jgi:hypothetical protein
MTYDYVTCTTLHTQRPETYDDVTCTTLHTQRPEYCARKYQYCGYTFLHKGFIIL